MLYVEIHNPYEILQELSDYVVLDPLYFYNPLVNISTCDLNFKLTYNHANMDGANVYVVVFIILPYFGELNEVRVLVLIFIHSFGRL